MDRPSKLKLLLTYSLLAAIFLLALFVRTFRIGDSPPSVNWDEASLGYNAYSLLHTGRDEYSTALPVSLRSFDDYKPALYSYLIVPFLTKLPLSDISTRLPSAIMGSLLTVSLFLISYLLTKSRALAIAAAIVIAVEPWAMHFSRAAFEANVANSLIFLALSLFLYAVRTKKFFTHSLVLFILSMYAYHSERIIALPLLILLFLAYKKELLPLVKRRLLFLICLACILLLPLGLNFLSDPIASRLGSTSILKLWPFIPSNFSPLIYNPGYAILWHFVGRLLAYFSPANLFVSGSTEPGQYIPTLGLMHTIEFPFWLMGLISLIWNKQVRKFLLPIMILSIIPALITWNWFSVVRTLTLYPLFSILVCLGLWFTWQKINLKHLKVILLMGVLGLWSMSVMYLVNTEVAYAPLVTAGEYQPGFEQAIPLLMTFSSSYDRVVIDSPHIAPYIFLLFYSQFDPHLYQQQVPRRAKNTGTESISFGKFEFRNIDWDQDKFLPHTLFLSSTSRLPDYEFTTQKYGKILQDVYDIRGYITMRFVTTN